MHCDGKYLIRSFIQSIARCPAPLSLGTVKARFSFLLFSSFSLLFLLSFRVPPAFLFLPQNFVNNAITAMMPSGSPYDKEGEAFVSPFPGPSFSLLASVVFRAGPTGRTNLWDEAGSFNILFSCIGEHELFGVCDEEAGNRVLEHLNILPGPLVWISESGVSREPQYLSTGDAPFIDFWCHGGSANRTQAL